MASTFHCYVDESGHSKDAHSFIVSTCIFQTSTAEFAKACSQNEHVTGKNNRKWRKSNHEVRMNYLRNIFSDASFRNVIFFSQFSSRVDYDQATIAAIAMAIQKCNIPNDAKAVVYVDGLSKKKVREYSVGLRKHGIKIRKVRGLRNEQSNPLMRLPDSVAGFLLDELERSRIFRSHLYQRARLRKTLIRS